MAKKAEYIIDESGCWLWQGAKDKDGYGAKWDQGRTRPAHIVSYENHVGPVPEGMVLDHLCRVRRCVNPEHLEPITQQENIMRGENQAATMAEREYCDHGHPFNEKNTGYDPEGYRYCKLCRALAARKSREKKPETVKPPKLQNPEKQEKRTVDLPVEDLAAMAATAAVRLVLEGNKSPTPQDVWRAIRMPEEYPTVPPIIGSVMQGYLFQRLFDLRLRRSTMSSLEEVVFLKDLARDITKLAGDGLVEDLLIHPDRMNPTEKRRTMLEVGELYERLTKPLGQPAATAGELPTPEEAAVVEASSMEESLQRVPAQLRARAIKAWKQGEIQRLGEEEARLLGQST